MTFHALVFLTGLVKDVKHLLTRAVPTLVEITEYAYGMVLHIIANAQKGGQAIYAQ